MRETKRMTSLRDKLRWNLVHLLTLVLACSGVPARSQNGPAPMGSEVVSQPDSDTIGLARVSVEKLFRRAVNVSCTESVTQSLLDRSDRPEYEEHSIYSYRLLPDNSSQPLKFVESRQEIEEPFHDPGRTMLVTDGFGNLLLILHPAYAASYTFQAEGREIVNGLPTLKFGFEPVPDAISPFVVQVRGRNYSVALNGTVWIEPKYGTVVKLAAFGGTGMSELGLQSIESEAEYQPIQLERAGEIYWMPGTAVIDAKTSKRHWRNTHRFTGCKPQQGTITATETEENVSQIGSKFLPNVRSPEKIRTIRSTSP